MQAGVVLGAIALGGIVVFVEAGLALVAPTMLALLVLWFLVRMLDGDDGERGTSLVMWWTMAAFALHLAFGLVVTHAGGIISEFLKAPDALTYNLHAIAILQHWQADFPLPLLPAGKEGYYYLLAGLYSVFGVHTVAGLVVNAMFGGALVPLVTDTTRRLFGSEAAARVAPLVILLPSMMLWPSQLIKEAPILFFIAVAANGTVRLTDRFAVLPLTFVALSMALMLTFRGHVALVLAGGVVASIAIGRREVLGGVGTGLVAASLLVVLLSFGLGYSGFDAAVNTNLEQAHRVRQDLALTGRSGYDVDVDISSSRQALSYLPRGLVNFSLGPFPWQIRSIRQLPVLPDMMVWWALVPSLWRGFHEARRLIGRRVLVLLLPAFTTACLLSLAVGNFGTLVRERMQVVLLLIPLIALGLSRRKAQPDASAPATEDLAVPA
jgi:4-amino-4-deoxy-L-arabinose transferase-like glycosyltransferase